MRECSRTHWSTFTYTWECCCPRGCFQCGLCNKTAGMNCIPASRRPRSLAGLRCRKKWNSHQRRNLVKISAQNVHQLKVFMEKRLCCWTFQMQIRFPHENLQFHDLEHSNWGILTHFDIPVPRPVPTVCCPTCFLFVNLIGFYWLFEVLLILRQHKWTFSISQSHSWWKHIHLGCVECQKW